MVEFKRMVKILLVEDNILSQKLMYFNLTKLGLDVTIANNGSEAIDLYSQSFYEVILMDVMMPLVDGYKATKSIREIEKISGNKSYIIGLTSNVYDSDKEKCLHSGMDDYMSKPFDIDRFCEILKNQNIL